MNLSVWAINKPIPAVMLFIVLTIGGWMSFNKLPVQNIPDLDLPTVTVTASLPGATAATMETEVTKKLEDSLASLELIDSITSSVSEGSSTTTIVFELEKSTQEAVDDVRDAVTKVRSDLPSDIREPVVAKMTMADRPILTYGVEATGMSAAELSWYIDNEVVNSLMGAKGVSSVQREGGVDREITVELDPLKMAALGVTAADVSRALKAAAADASGGRTDFSGMEQAIRTLGAVRSIDALKQLPLALAGGRHVVLSEVATIIDGATELRKIATLDGTPIVMVQVYRSSGSSEVDVAAQIRAEVSKLQEVNPLITIKEISNTVERVQDQYDASMTALYEGAALAVIVVFMFLRNPRATLVSAAALPLSIIPTFWAMYVFGFTLNTITLLALTLVVGILVDDAIVEVENIVRHLGMGKDPVQAAKDASTEIGLAVVATTFTLVAVFLPTAFMAGIPGKFFKQFGWTAAISVLASLLVARILTPVMAAYMLKPMAHEEPQPRWISKYLHWLTYCLRNPLKTGAAALVFFVLSMATMTMLPSGFMPQSDEGKIRVSVELAPGSKLADTQLAMEAVRSLANKLPETEQVYYNAGRSDVRTGTVTIDLKDDRARKQVEVERELREALTDIPGAKFGFRSGGSGSTLSMVISGDNPEVLESTADAIIEGIRGISGIGNVSSSASLLRPELVIKPDLAKAAELGVTAADIGQAVRVATTGDFDTNLAKLNLPERQLPIRVTLPEEVRQSPELMGQLRVASANGGTVPISAFSELYMDAGPAKIDRYDRRRNVTLSVELAGRELGDVMKEINKLSSVQNLPEGVERQASGDMERMQEMFGSFGLAMLLGVMAIYGVLVLLFHNFAMPATILVALPLSVGGAVIALLIGNYSMSMPVLIGLLMLMGIATKNSILLVEYGARAQRERAISALDAIQEACAKRVRPILMTTAAMGAGMVPIAMATQGDASFRAPMAYAVIGGLLTSTVLSLFVVPAVYLIVDRLLQKVARLRGRGV